MRTNRATTDSLCGPIKSPIRLIDSVCVPVRPIYGNRVTRYMYSFLELPSTHGFARGMDGEVEKDGE